MLARSLSLAFLLGYKKRTKTKNGILGHILSELFCGMPQGSVNKFYIISLCFKEREG